MQRNTVMTRTEQEVDSTPNAMLLREIFALCESTENECVGRLDSFKRGRAFEAKRIRQSIGTWYQDMFCGSSFMGEPVAPKHPSTQASEPAPGLKENV